MNSIANPRPACDTMSPRPDDCDTISTACLLLDTFTDEDGTYLADHTPESGAWTLTTWAGAGSWPQINGNAATSRGYSSTFRPKSGAYTDCGQDAEVTARVSAYGALIDQTFFVFHWDGLLSASGTNPVTDVPTNGVALALIAFSVTGGTRVYAIEYIDGATAGAPVLLGEFLAPALDLDVVAQVVGGDLVYAVTPVDAGPTPVTGAYTIQNTHDGVYTGFCMANGSEDQGIILGIQIQEITIEAGA